MNSDPPAPEGDVVDNSDGCHLEGLRRDEGFPRWTSEQLLRGREEVVILHGDEENRLRCTMNNKLILYK